MDIFVLPSSSREGLGISIIEAMAAEKPVVATDIGGIPEVVKDGETGYLAPPKNPEALAQAIIKLIQNPTDAKAMGTQGRIRFEKKFTKKRMLSEIENLYEGLMDKKIRKSSVDNMIITADKTDNKLIMRAEKILADKKIDKEDLKELQVSVNNYKEAKSKNKPDASEAENQLLDLLYFLEEN